MQEHAASTLPTIGGEQLSLALHSQISRVLLLRKAIGLFGTTGGFDRLSGRSCRDAPDGFRVGLGGGGGLANVGEAVLEGSLTRSGALVDSVCFLIGIGGGGFNFGGLEEGLSTGVVGAGLP